MEVRQGVSRLESVRLTVFRWDCRKHLYRLSTSLWHGAHVPCGTAAACQQHACAHTCHCNVLNSETVPALALQQNTTGICPLLQPCCCKFDWCFAAAPYHPLWRGTSCHAVRMQQCVSFNHNRVLATLRVVLLPKITCFKSAFVYMGV